MDMASMGGWMLGMAPMNGQIPVYGFDERADECKMASMEIFKVGEMASFTVIYDIPAVPIGHPPRKSVVLRRRIHRIFHNNFGMKNPVVQGCQNGQRAYDDSKRHWHRKNNKCLLQYSNDSN
jgi:hypothetical protein